MLDSLDDNHVGWDSRKRRTGAQYGYGILDAATGQTPRNIKDATPPLYVKLVVPGSPADKAGLKPGDIMVAVNYVPVEINGITNGGALDWLRPKSDKETLRLTVKRPATGKTWTVEMQPERLTSQSRPTMSVTLLPGDIAKVVLPAFAPGVAGQVLKEIAKLRETTKLRGIVFDVRGNSGGRADVTNGDCASACDDFTANVKYLGLGKVVGERTRGEASGLQHGYQLNNDTVLLLPKLYRTWANAENVNEIGVPVDCHVPLTAEDISNGRDPGVDKARDLLKS